MKTTINEYDFLTAFRDWQSGAYKDNFSYNGLRALFNYLEEYEDSTDTEIDLDIVALCCDYTEHKDIYEFLKEYPNTLIKTDKYSYETDDNIEGYEEALLEELRDHTQVIEIDGSDSFIIQVF